MITWVKHLRRAVLAFFATVCAASALAAQGANVRIDAIFAQYDRRDSPGCIQL